MQGKRKNGSEMDSLVPKASEFLKLDLGLLTIILPMSVKENSVLHRVELRFPE